MRYSLFGGSETEVKNRTVYKVQIGNLDKSFDLVLEIVSELKICSNVPKLVDFDTITELKERGIIISDLQSDDHEIDLLLGANIVGALITGKSSILKSGLLVVETIFGNTVMGKQITNSKITCDYKNDKVLNVLSLHVNNSKVSEMWDLDAIGILDPVKSVENGSANARGRRCQSERPR